MLAQLLQILEHVGPGPQGHTLSAALTHGDFDCCSWPNSGRWRFPGHVSQREPRWWVRAPCRPEQPVLPSVRRRLRAAAAGAGQWLIWAACHLRGWWVWAADACRGCQLWPGGRRRVWSAGRGARGWPTGLRPAAQLWVNIRFWVATAAAAKLRVGRVRAATPAAAERQLRRACRAVQCWWPAWLVTGLPAWGKWPAAGELPQHSLTGLSSACTDTAYTDIPLLFHSLASHIFCVFVCLLLRIHHIRNE